MWCAMPIDIRSPAAIEPTSWQTDSVTAHAVYDVAVILVASARHAPGSRCERRHDQRSRRSTVH
jgi:hypothetical protein